MNLTGIVLTKNEEKNLSRCLTSLSFCNEILVIDDESKDKTVEVAKRYNAEVIVHPLKNFSDQRNLAVEKAKNDWLLYIDADEEVTPELQKEIEQLLSESHDNTVFSIPRRDFWWGKELRYGETKKVREQGLIRLIKKGTGDWQRPIHEVFVPHTNIKVKRLFSFINHYPHQSIKEFLQEINFYSSLRAKELYKTGVKTNAAQVILFPLGKFLLTYFLKLGFLDGPAGFGYSFFMSFHSFLVRAKLYQYHLVNEKSK